MIKTLIISGVLFAIPALGLATNEGNGNGNGGPEGGTTVGPTGPQGATGPQGSPGINGNNGQDGKAGLSGANGVNGKDGKDTSARFAGTDLAGDFAVRLLDTKYVQLQAFDQYVFGSTPGSDIFGNGHNSTIGARVVFKVGRSWEEELIDKQARQLAALEAQMSRLMR